VEFIASRGGRITPRDLQRSNNRKYPTAAHAEIALDALAGAGVGGWEEAGAAAKGGHPTEHPGPRPTHDTNGRTSPAGESDDQGAHDATAGTTPGTPQNSSVSEGSVGSVMRQAEAPDPGTTGMEGPGLCQAPEEGAGGSVVQGPESDEVEEGFIEWPPR